MIDVLKEGQAWEARQILKRGEAMVRQAFSVSDELILNRKLQGALQGAYALSDDEAAQVAAFQGVTLQAQAAIAQAHTDNARLVLALAYEQAQRDLSRLTLLIEGRPEVPAVDEVLEERDPDTGEVLVAYVAPVPAVPAIEPLPLTMDGVDEAGAPITIENPAYTTAVALRDQAQAVIDAATPATLELVSARAGQ